MPVLSVHAFSEPGDGIAYAVWCLRCRFGDRGIIFRFAAETGDISPL